MEIAKKLYELEIRFVEICTGKGDQWNLAVFCEDSAGVVYVGGRIFIRLLNFCSDSVVEMVLRKGEIEIGSFEYRVYCLCEGSITGEFCKVIKVPVVEGNVVKLKIAGGLRVLKVQEGIGSKEKTGGFKEIDEVISLSGKVDEKIGEMKKEIFEFYGVMDKGEEVGKGSLFEIFSDVQLKFEVSQDSDKDFLIELVLALVQRVEMLREEENLIDFGKKFIDQCNGEEKIIDVSGTDNSFSEIIERINQEIQGDCGEVEKYSTKIEEIKVKIEEVRDNCEAISNENEKLVIYSNFEEIQNQILELNEKITKSEQELFNLSQNFKLKTTKNDLAELNLKKLQVSKEKYDLLTKLHQLESELEDIVIENNDLQTEIKILDSQKSQILNQNPKTELKIEKFKENFKSLCHESAKDAFDSAITITDLETFTSYLKREIDHSKYKLITKDSEHESIQAKLKSLQTANNSAEKLIKKELNSSPKSSLQHIQTSTVSYDTVLNEIDFLSNLILLQAKTWADESSLRFQLSQRLEDLNS